MNRVYINPLWCYVSVLVTISYLPMLPCPPFPLKIRPPFPPFPPFRLTPSWRPCWQLPTWDWKTEKMSRKNLSNCFLPVGCPNYHPVIGLLLHPHYWRNGDWGPRRGYLRIDLKKKKKNNYFEILTYGKVTFEIWMIIFKLRENVNMKTNLNFKK